MTRTILSAAVLTLALAAAPLLNAQPTSMPTSMPTSQPTAIECSMVCPDGEVSVGIRGPGCGCLGVDGVIIETEAPCSADACAEACGEDSQCVSWRNNAEGACECSCLAQP